MQWLQKWDPRSVPWQRGHATSGPVGIQTSLWDSHSSCRAAVGFWCGCRCLLHASNTCLMCASNMEPNTCIQHMHTTDVSNMCTQCMNATCPMAASSTRIQHIFSVWPTYAPKRVQHTHLLCASNAYIQHMHPTHTHEVYIQHTKSTCAPNMSTQHVHPMHTSNTRTQYVHPTQWHRTSVSTAHGSLHVHCLETTSSCPDFFLC